MILTDKIPSGNEIGNLNTVGFSVGVLINKLDRDSLDGLITKMRKLFRRVLHAKDIEIREVNTFLFFHLSVPKQFVETTEKRKLAEQYVISVLRDYAEKEKKSFSKEIKSNVEIKELTDIIVNAIKSSLTAEPNKLIDEITSKIYSISQRVSQLVADVFANTYVLFWDFKSQAPDVVVFPSAVILREAYSEKLNFPLKTLVENVAAIQLAKMCMSNLVQNLSTVEFAVTDINEYFSDEERLITLKEHINVQLWKTLRAIFGLLSSSQQVVSDILKQIKRTIELKNELNSQIAAIKFPELFKFLKQLSDQMFCDKIAAKMEYLKTKIKLANTHLLSLINSASVKMEKSKDISKLARVFSYTLAELQILKFYTEKFRDLAFFQTIPSDVYVEDLGTIDVPENNILIGKALFKTYRLFGSTVYALRGVNVELNRGEMVAIVGPSGSGKTTLLNLLSGLDTPDRGAVFIFGKNIRKMTDNQISMIRRKHMGFIFQYYNLIPQLTVLENVMLPGIMLGQDSAEVKKRALKLLEEVGIERFKDQFPIKLSGGQMQRVTIARSMINEPSILFADEPTGDLDSETGKIVVDLIHRFSKEKNMTVVFVTHDMEMAKRCDRILKIDDGRIID